MKSFAENLVVADDKANAEDLLLAAEKLSDRQLASIPRCLYRYIQPDGTPLPIGETPGVDDITVPDVEVLVVLSWVRARRDNPEVDFEAVKKSIPVTDGAKIREINKELYYFFTDLSREEVSAIFERPVDENPPEGIDLPSDSASETKSEA